MLMETSIKRPLFGKEVEIAVQDVPKEIAMPIMEKAYEEGVRLQKIFNVYDKNSELSVLNKKRKLKVSKELLEVLKAALIYCDDNYDISKGILFKARKEGKQAKQEASYRDIIIEDNQVMLKRDAIIDLGSIAKGYIVDRMLSILEENGIIRALVDGRGDLRFLGEMLIDIQHPRKDAVYRTLQLKDSAVATSGDYSQYKRGFNHSHILNKKDIISATVVAPTLMKADLFATLLTVSDKEKREHLLKDNPDIEAFLVTA